MHFTSDIIVLNTILVMTVFFHDLIYHKKGFFIFLMRQIRTYKQIICLFVSKMKIYNTGLLGFFSVTSW